jgi:adenine deaminase
MPQLSGHIVDIFNQRTYPGTVSWEEGRITAIRPADSAVPEHFILPGFVDAHVHIESSMLVPTEFARLAVVHGTVATVSDPHEIGNVLGVEGVQWMIANGRKSPFKFYFGAPSCVPATPFETAGAEIDAAGVRQLLEMPEVKYLAEMMNWPGVLNRDPVVMEKIGIAQVLGKPVDGHAPGLKGEQARQYIEAGISTDHECFTAEEALDKLRFGMKVAIREGSAAKNFEALYPLLHDHWQQMMLCSDDKHPDSLVLGHINSLVARAVAHGVDVYKALQAACINPVLHYGLEVGLLRDGDPADFIVVDSLTDFRVLATYIDGTPVAENGQTLLPHLPASPVNQFNCSPKSPADFSIEERSPLLLAIEALDGQLITNPIVVDTSTRDGFAIAESGRNLLKLTVVNRYHDAPPAVAFIRNFGLQHGAIAGSVGHDSHNILAVGADDISLARAVNLVIEHRGGLSAVDGTREALLPLPVAGLMATDDGYEVARQYEALDAMAKEMGSTLASPYMTLSFMALLVIPNLKLSDKGLFNGEWFGFEEMWVR